MHELEPIAAALADHRPHRMPLRRRLKRAAIAAILRESRQGTELLVIERARRHGDPWSGHLGLPGGRLAAGDDRSGSLAAIRETREEIGVQLDPSLGMGRLSDIVTLDHARRAPLALSPFVYRWPTDNPRIVCNHEIADWRWLPLAWLDEPINRGTVIWRRFGFGLRLPSYDCGDDRQLWGLTLRVVDELLAIARRATSR
ncbi:CoA pyrophosphatase [Salinisphaera sp. Q1T1-3]|uniref:NUDIX hydrolase n=1 Tax=Salinisphaera sp. Q1T1-3 TaxID=2321229 RepID=UPI000E73B7FF|nr:CoA pyrophosphatase [Salinisphaera sp. Q1T1-3]RJS92878.1 CoA pyrophosphatase [Salinisphaera sp. Q1T1-3]